jgi:plastocyanin
MARRLLFPVLVACLAGSHARALEHKVIVTDNPAQRFDPQSLTIQVGDTVVWQNVSGTHNVIADDASFDSGSPAAAPWTYSHTFNSTGKFLYKCSAHSGDGQVGLINVRTARPANEIAYTVSSWDMQRRSTIAGPEGASDFTRDSGEFLGGVRLPSGVKITAFEVSACDDTSIAGGTTATLLICPEPVSACLPIAIVQTTPVVTGDPCGITTTTLADGPIVDNADNTYGLYVATFLEGFRGVKIYYKKVLSPAPLTATFGDVPTTHQFFRAIEGLYASGITQGCGNGNFCPNDTVTRATMAGFMARALGLFWPN